MKIGPLSSRLLLVAVVIFSQLGSVPVHGAVMGSVEEKSPPTSLNMETEVRKTESRPSALPLKDRDRVLGEAWRRSSDVAVTTSGDAGGLRVMIARAKDGYDWKTAATLSEPGFETDLWIGSACVTGSGRFAGVVYAPRHFVNRSYLFDRGAFAASVDLKTGAVTKLPHQVSLAYFNPGCGLGDDIAFTQAGDTDLGKTRVHVFDAVRGRVSRSLTLRGQVTSPVPSDEKVIAARGESLLEISEKTGVRELASARSVPFDVHLARDGSIVYAEHSGDLVSVIHYTNGVARTLAQGRLGEVSVQAGVHGEIFLVGETVARGALPERFHQLSGVPAGARLSSRGELAVISHLPERLAARPGSSSTDREATEGAEAVSIDAVVTVTKAKAEFRFFPSDASSSKVTGGREPNRAVAAARNAGTSAPPEKDPVDPDRKCAVPRNDARVQVYQPHWRQVEWAVDHAVFGRLPAREANWRQSGLPAWNPQQMFPWRPVAGTAAGRIPAQVVLGVLAQESNLWQASPHALEGETGNPNIGNYYGVNLYDADTGNDWLIDWSKADCGYGVGQVTDGMQVGSTSRTPLEQKAIALDYATNIAAGVEILRSKWDQIHNDTAGAMRANDGDPSKVENWYFAIWAYNSGWHPKSEANGSDVYGPNNGAWGLGWANNPANPRYRAGRKPFLHNDHYQDAAEPQNWTYQERVLGFAAWPIAKTEKINGKETTDPGYRAAWWNNAGYRNTVVPASSTDAVIATGAFCSDVVGTDNQCNFGTSNPNDRGEPAGPCRRGDLKCWWHFALDWKGNCSVTCGHEGIRYDPPYIEKEDPAADWYQPSCTVSGLPAGSLIVDDLPAGTPAVRKPCDNAGWSNSGNFELTFARDRHNFFSSKIDFHQLGSGFGGHQWFAYSRTPDKAFQKVTGKWTLNQPINGWARVLVHLPQRRAHAQQARYDIYRGDAATGVKERSRVLQQRLEANSWVSLGVFSFAGTPSVSMSSEASFEKTGSEDGTAAVAWDAVAFQKLPGKPKNFIVAMGDSYSSGEGASDGTESGYYRDSNNNGKNASRNACHRSRYAWSRRAVLLPESNVAIGQRADGWDTDMDYHLVACSGAETEQLLPTKNFLPGEGDVVNPIKNAFGDANQGQYREPSQIDKGYLDENTTLVTVSIGGNDAGFSDVLKTCLLNAHGSGDPEGDNCQNLIKSDGRTVDAVERELIQGKVQQSIRTVLEVIHRRAPNARIVLMSYPHVVENGSCIPSIVVPGFGSIGRLTDGEVVWIRQMGDLMVESTAVTAQAARQAGIPVTMGDPRPQFAGRSACAANTAVHGLILVPTDGDNGTVSAQSFHPNLDGTVLYARTLEAALGQVSR
ncbi:hypothetical protein GCM10017673_16850 [Streptosporangium violaceochromogenes]|nr:hypothetical protein GCM10017673_16850 [Streptosporangium violaceochromogenes]